MDVCKVYRDVNVPNGRDVRDVRDVYRDFDANNLPKPNVLMVLFTRPVKNER